MGMTSSEQIIASAAISCQNNQNIRIICPECGPDRRKKDPTLGITVDGRDVVYHCFHCQWSGKISSENPLDKYKKVSQIPTKINMKQLPPIHDSNADAIKAFFSNRGIDLPDVSSLPITTGNQWFPEIKKERPAIGFVYGPKDSPRAVKWRPADGSKMFTQSGAARELYGMDQFTAEDKEICLVEGECDAIALRSIGIKSVSVPNGAPMKVSHGRISAESDNKFSYLWQAKEQFDAAEKVILAVDADSPGDALAEEIARRVGRGKCYRVRYPEGSKDPTDVIAKHGAEEMRRLIKDAKPVPLAGVYSAEDYKDKLLEVYRDGFGGGESTGFASVDKLFTVKAGMLYIVTGLAGSGKSTFIDQVLYNLARMSHWKAAVASYENPPSEHIIKFSEKIIGKPFHEGPTPRMSPEELEEAFEFVRDHVAFLENREGAMDTVGSIIERCKQAVMRLGVRVLVIDPFNYIKLESDQEHKAIEVMLSELKAFAMAYDIALFMVAHPTKIPMRDDGTYPVPKGMQISGSYAWVAKADIGITVHRPKMQGLAEIHCWKARFKSLGSLGHTTLRYDKITERYFENDGFKRTTDSIW